MRIILFLLFFSCPGIVLAWPAIVLKIHDGDTLSVLPSSANDCPVTVRLYGIDAPEKKQPGGEDAQRALVGFLPKNTVIEVVPMDTDKYGRIVAIITTKGHAINAQMLAAGQAWVFDKYCRAGRLCRKWKRLQITAQQEKRGIWAANNAVPPWDWRKFNK